MKFREHKIKKNQTDNPCKKSDDESLELNSSNLKKILSKSSDIIFRDIYVNGCRELPVTMVFVDGLVNLKAVNDDILKPLTQERALSNVKTESEIIELIEHGMIYNLFQKTRKNIPDCTADLLSGAAALLFDNEKTAVTFEVRGFEKRAITEPTVENVFKGPKDSFVETLRMNTATVRRKIKAQNLVIEETILGKQSNTSIAIVYMYEIANQHLIEEVKKRLGKIEVDAVLTTGVIEELIADEKYQIFPQIQATERPDRFCANVMEGRVGLLIDGIPISFIIPASLAQFLQAPEDYSQNYIVSSIIRSLRYILAHASLLLPGFYISVIKFHQEMLPAALAISIKAARQGVPFPSFIEVMFMLIAFEVLVEAGLRLPRTIGQAISIVGALVVGQSAITAKLLSPAVVVVIAITAISSFAMPNQDFSNTLRVWRFILVVFSSIIGLFGLGIGWLVLLFMLSRAESFGVAYLSPLVANEDKQLQDSIFRLHYSFLKKRPIDLNTANKKRSN